MADTADLKRRLLAIEERFWTDGVEYYREQLASECLMLFPGAGMLTREAIIAGVAGGSRWRNVQIDDAHLVRLGQGSAVFAYRATARREGQAHDYIALVSSVYVEQDGAWKLAFHQQSPA
jgi:hypothetical protein